MKFLLKILAIGLFVVTVKAAMDKKEAKEMMRGMCEECKEKENATDADMDTMLDEKYPETREGKCLVACMQETFGVVVDKKFSVEGFKAVASMAAGDDEEMLKKMDEIARECEHVSDPDRCEQAIKIGKCLEEGAKKRGLKPE